MNKLKSLISIIKTGEPAEVREAQKQIDDYYKNHDFPLTKKTKKRFEIFVDETKSFYQVDNPDNQAYFIYTLKYPFLAIGEEYFDFFSDFIVSAIQHRSGKVRQAVLKTIDWLLISNVYNLDRINRKLPKKEIDSQNRKRDIFCRLVCHIEELIEKYDEPCFNRYKYISSMPVSIYKSLQFLLVNNLLRSPYYQKIYQDWLKKLNNQPRDFIHR